MRVDRKPLYQFPVEGSGALGFPIPRKRNRPGDITFLIEYPADARDSFQPDNNSITRHQSNALRVAKHRGRQTEEGKEKEEGRGDERGEKIQRDFLQRDEPAGKSSLTRLTRYSRQTARKLGYR